MISLGLWAAGLFGKSIGLDAAKKLGLWLGIAIAIVVLVLGLIVGKHFYDNGITETFQLKQDAKVVKDARAADMKADEALAKEADEREEENANLTTALAEAKQADPVKGKATVGKVQQSYFDNLPIKGHKK